MVCLGNICRSPMAQGIMEWKLREKGLDHFVDSAGTSDYHTGEEPDHRAVQVCIERGVDISMYRARPFTPADFSRFDRIYVMDGSNLRDVLNLSGDNRQKHKVSLILNTLHPGSNRKVPIRTSGVMKALSGYSTCSTRPVKK